MARLFFEGYRVYSDLQKTVVLVSNQGSIATMSKVSKSDKFDFNKGMMAALVRSWLKWDHPDLPQGVSMIANYDTYQGMLVVVSQSLELNGPIIDLSKKWEIVDLFSNLSSLKIMTQFFPD